MNLQVGDFIALPCDVQDGPFEDEKIVQFDTMDGPVSGFAQTGDVREFGGIPHIKAQVVSIETDTVTVRVRGSFFTTNGLATFAASSPYERLAA